MTRASELFGGGGGIHFSDPWQLLPRVSTVADLFTEDDGGFDHAASSTDFFTDMASRGLQDQTNWTADTYKTLLTVSSGKGLVAAIVGPTAGGAETTTFEFTVDGVLTEVPILCASGERAFMAALCMASNTFTTASRFAIQGGSLNAGKTTLGTPGTLVDTLLAGWPLVTALGTPCLKFNTSLLIRAKHSANITNSTATAYSGVMYRLGIA